MRKYLHQIVVIALLIVGIAASMIHKKQTAAAVPASNDNWPSSTQPK